MLITELETPVPVIDLDVVDANIARMQVYCTAHGLRLRPHVKTHKLPYLAHRQLRAGAQGVTAQKLSEAEVMALAGVEDILLTYNVVGEAKVQRLARLARLCRLSVSCDNVHALEETARAAQLANLTLPVLIEFDSGGDRTGVRTAAGVLSLAQRLNATPGLSLRGLMTYPLSEQTAERVRGVAALFAAHGLSTQILSVGGTPTATGAHQLGHLLPEAAIELRVGTYLYNDCMMVHAGAATLADCALHVHATVISTPTPERVILDAGSKTLSSDVVSGLDGYGHLLDFPGAVIVRLNEEHAVVDVSNCRVKPATGERVRIVPNHVCVVTNLHSEVVLHRGGEVLAHAPVLARGKTW